MAIFGLQYAPYYGGRLILYIGILIDYLVPYSASSPQEYASAVYSMSPRLAENPSPLVYIDSKLCCKQQGRGFIRKMRIGVLLERLNVHSPSAVFADVLRCLDRRRFEVGERMMM